MAEQKYVVVKKSEWDAYLGNSFLGDTLDDAVVIRLKDRFAGPALHAYVAAVQNAIEILEEVGYKNGVTETLEELRQTFWEFAVDADGYHAKRIPS